MTGTLSLNKIQSELKDRLIGSNIYFFDEVASTNDTAKLLAKKDAPSGAIIVSDSQTAGKGRMGRRWVSHKGTGVYLSVILKPDNDCANPFFFTIISGIAATLAIQKITGANAVIKWPNDVLMEGKKVAGILTETSYHGDNIEFAVIGIGINVSTDAEQFPFEVRESAASIKMISGTNISRTDLIICLCKELERWYNKYLHGEINTIKDQWNRISCTVGKHVTIDTGSERVTGIAAGISDNALLVIETSCGEIKEVRM